MEQLVLDDIRTGPALGYDSPTKRLYRERVWKCLQQATPLNENELAVILPSKEGLEIADAITHGVKERNLIAVDRDQRVFDTADWKDIYPEVKCITSKISEFHINSQQGDKKIKVANLDLCGALGQDTLNEIKSFLDNNVFTDTFYLAVTVAKGRESAFSHTLMQLIPLPPLVECSRIGVLWHYLKLDNLLGTIVGQGQYASWKGSHPMSWAVIRLEKREGKRVSIKAISATANPIRSLTLQQLRSFFQMRPRIMDSLVENLQQVKSDKSTWQIRKRLLDLGVINDFIPDTCIRDCLRMHPNVKMVRMTGQVEYWSYSPDPVHVTTRNRIYIRQAITLYLQGCSEPKSIKEIKRFLIDNELMGDVPKPQLGPTMCKWPEFENLRTQGRDGLWTLR